MATIRARVDRLEAARPAASGRSLSESLRAGLVDDLARDRICAVTPGWLEELARVNPEEFSRFQARQRTLHADDITVGEVDVVHARLVAEGWVPGPPRPPMTDSEWDALFRLLRGGGAA